MKSKILILAGIASAAIASAQTQERPQTRVEQYIDSLKNTHRIEYLGEGDKPTPDDERALLDIFYYDQFRNAQDPRAPYFLFMSRDANFAMGLGGVVRMRGWYDWDGSMPNNGFIPYNIAIPKNTSRERWLGSTPAGTALYFRVLGTNTRVGDYQLYIEANFDGYNQRDFLLKKAYATLNDWTVGYAHSTFSDPLAEPLLVDGQGPNAYVSTTAVLVRWMHHIQKDWIMAASLEMPQSFVGANGTTTQAINDWLPNLAAFSQYEWAPNQHVRLAGILRTLPYRDLVVQENRSEIGWGVQLSSVMRPWKPLTLYFMGNYGQGISSLTGDLMMGNYDLVNNPEQEGTMYAPRLFGWYGAAQYHFTPNLFTGVTVGQLRYLPEHETSDTEYKYGLYSALNLFWNITPRIQVGGEYNLGMRKNMGGEHRMAQRISVMTQFSF